MDDGPTDHANNDNNLVVPYRDTSNVLLRHENQLVVYDRQSRQIALRDAPAPAVPANLSTDISLPTCPYCGKPQSDSETLDTSTEDLTTEHDDDDEFINPDYFRLLGNSLSRGSEHNTPPGSPRRYIRRPTIEDGESPPNTAYIQPERSRSRPLSGHGISSSAFSANYFEKFFVTERELGRGGKGVVLLVKHVLDGVFLGYFACKRVPVGDDHEWLRKVLLEVQLLQQLSHSNLVSYRHVWLEDVVLTNFGPSVPCAFILQQYCNSGDLHNFILQAKPAQTKEQLKDRIRRMSRGQPLAADNRPRRLPFDQIISFFRDIAAGLHHLHSNGFIHRDLKPSNCLLHDIGVPGAELRVLVSDFGEVQIENSSRKSSGATGTVSYCAPEVLRRVGPDGQFGNFTTKSDIFSLGMILYFMCFGRLPYINADTENEENEDLESLRAEISAWNGFEERYREARADLPEKLFASLKHLLSTDPNKRPSAADICLRIGSEYGFGEDPVPLRGHMSPKAQTPGVSGINDENRFFRISPVPDSSTPTPTLTPVSSFPGGRNNMNLAPSVKNTTNQPHHRRMPSRLRERLPYMKQGEPVYTDDTPSSDMSDASANVQIGTKKHLLTTENSSSMILRPRKETKQLMASNGSIAQPVLVESFFWRSIATPQVWLLVKMLLFLAKITSITSPCLPLAPNSWLFYPLLLLSTLDLAITHIPTSAIFIGVHVASLVFASSTARLCTRMNYPA